MALMVGIVHSDWHERSSGIGSLVDRELASAMRAIRSTGRTVELLVEMIQELSDADRVVVNNTLTWGVERLALEWEIMGKRFPIAHLGVSTLMRLINTPSAQRRQSLYLASGRDVTEYDGRIHKYVIVLMEAESRGILSDVQRSWEDVLRGLATKPLMGVFCGCMGDIVPHDNMFVCVTCRKAVKREEALLYARNQLRGRLRRFVSRLC